MKLTVTTLPPGAEESVGPVSLVYVAQSSALISVALLASRGYDLNSILPPSVEGQPPADWPIRLVLMREAALGRTPFHSAVLLLEDQELLEDHLVARFGGAAAAFLLAFRGDYAATAEAAYRWLRDNGVDVQACDCETCAAARKNAAEAHEYHEAGVN